MISKNEVINLIQNVDLTKIRGALQGIKNIFSYIKMIKEVLTFGEIEIEKKKKNNIYRYKTSIFLKDVDIEKVHVMLPKTSAYVNFMMDKLNRCVS